MGPIGKFRRLAGFERRLVVNAAFLVVVMRIALWMLPFDRVRRAAARLGRPRGAGAPLVRPSAERISWAVAASAGHLPGVRNCLAKALAAQVMLGRFGYPSQLKIGVTKTPSGDFEAHAWLESEGCVLIGESERSRYMELAGPGARSL